MSTACLHIHDTMIFTHSTNSFMSDSKAENHIIIFIDFSGFHNPKQFSEYLIQKTKNPLKASINLFFMLQLLYLKTI